VIDFTRGNEILSAKTTSTADSVDRLVKHIRELARFQPASDVLVTKRILDLRLGPGLESSDFMLLESVARDLEVALEISPF